MFNFLKNLFNKKPLKDDNSLEIESLLEDCKKDIVRLFSHHRENLNNLDISLWCEEFSIKRISSNYLEFFCEDWKLIYQKDKIKICFNLCEMLINNKFSYNIEKAYFQPCDELKYLKDLKEFLRFVEKQIAHKIFLNKIDETLKQYEQNK